MRRTQYNTTQISHSRWKWHRSIKGNIISVHDTIQTIRINYRTKRWVSFEWRVFDCETANRHLICFVEDVPICLMKSIERGPKLCKAQVERGSGGRSVWLKGHDLWFAGARNLLKYVKKVPTELILLAVHSKVVDMSSVEAVVLNLWETVCAFSADGGDLSARIYITWHTDTHESDLQKNHGDWEPNHVVCRRTARTDIKESCAV